ncbi:hypothetical protein Y032_0139g2104 [Ancylostoma ceylanicum]|uniref:Uncharacterized protein n=1 Tax=Ancylostoma ceylanicum TaxID=53326 RepID=A0A016T4T1_9BILA|nr:hypothetical protein Y032_0139g2104 [Ancylostoma ceylanicum]
MTQLRIVVVSLLLLAAVAVLYLGGLKSVKLEPIYNNIAELNRVVKNLTQIEEISNAWMRDYYTKQALERVTQLHNIGDSSGFQILYNVIVPESLCAIGEYVVFERVEPAARARRVPLVTAVRGFRSAVRTPFLRIRQVSVFSGYLEQAGKKQKKNTKHEKTGSTAHAPQALRARKLSTDCAQRL